MDWGWLRSHPAPELRSVVSNCWWPTKRVYKFCNRRRKAGNDRAPLSDALQTLQTSENWPVTTTPQNLTFFNYAFWSSPISTLWVGASMGQFRYVNDGQTTTVSDTYAFPFTSPNWSTGGTDNHNAALSLALGTLGTPVPESGTWPTPTSSTSQNSSIGK